MPSKRPKLPIFLIVILAALGMAAFAFEFDFAVTAKSIQGSVATVERQNDNCGDLHTLYNDPCTKFTTKIDYTIDGSRTFHVFSTEWRDGNDLPLSAAPFKSGDKINLKYDPDHPELAKINASSYMWLGALFPGILLFLLLLNYIFPKFRTLLDLSWFDFPWRGSD